MATVDVEVSTDGYAEYGGGFNTSDVELYVGTYDAGWYSLQPVMRFTGITIPAGATITSAKVQVYGTWAPGTGLPSIVIRADNAASPTLPASYANFTAMARTTASATWAVPGDWAINTWFDTADIADVIQELVDDNGAYSSGVMQIIFDEPGTAWSVGQVVAFRSIDTGSSPKNAARLVIEYTEDSAEPVTLTPDGHVSVSGIVDQSAGTTNLHQAVDESWSSPDGDTTYLVNSGRTDGNVVLSLSDTPSDFEEMETLSVRVRARVEA